MRSTTTLPEHYQQQTQTCGWLTMDSLRTMMLVLPEAHSATQHKDERTTTQDWR